MTTNYDTPAAFRPGLFPKHLYKRPALLLHALLLGATGLASAGNLDLTFNPGAGANPRGVISLLEQADGKILLGGNFGSYDSLTRTSIARANTDGSVDISFNPGAGLDRVPRSIEQQVDGKIIVVGDFSTYDNVERTSIARIYPDGSLDTAYNPGARYYTGTLLHASALQTDGKLLVSGASMYSKGTADPLPAVERFNTDGTLDTLFASQISTNDGVVSRILVQPDGKILVAGSFHLSGISQNSIRRLNSDGSLDTSFFSGQTVVTGRIEDAALQSDGKVVIVGSFTTYRGTPRNRIARVNADGSLDTSFDPGSGVQIDGQTGGSLWTVALQDDGRLVIAGSFDRYDGVARLWLTRVNANGSLDTTFDTGTGPDDVLNTIAMQDDGKILIGGFFFNYNGVRRDSIARLNSGQLSRRVHFDTSALSGSEAETVEVLVRRGEGSTGAVSVPFSVGGTATEADFTITSPPSLRVEFGEGEFEESVVISLASDAADHAEKTIILELQTPEGDASVGNPSTTTVTITEPTSVTSRPDGLIGFHRLSLVGNDLYGLNGVGQTISAKVRRGFSKRCLLHVQNDGVTTESIRVEGSRGFSKTPVSYFLGKRNVTQAVTAGTFRFPNLAPGGGGILEVVVEVEDNARRRKTAAFSFYTISGTDPAAKDRVVLKVTTK